MEERGEEMEEGSLIEMLGTGEEEGYLFGPPSSLPSATAYMLYFAGHKGEEAVPFHGVAQKSSDSSLSSLSSSPPSTTTTATVTSSKSSKKKVGDNGGGGRRAATGCKSNTNTSVPSKKPKTEDSTGGHGSIKVRKKLGERIMALQQLVSPFGKSDTASVLLEALGYIRFLHDQVQALSSPYLQRMPSSAHLHEGRAVEARTNDLRSRGLCLVPVSCTEHVANSNGADLWSPTVGCTDSSSASSKR